MNDAATYHIRLRWTGVEDGRPWPVVEAVEFPMRMDAVTALAMIFRVETDASKIVAANLINPYPADQREYEALEYVVVISGPPEKRVIERAAFSRRPSSQVEAAFLHYKMATDVQNTRMLTDAQMMRAQAGAGSLLVPAAA